MSKSNEEIQAFLKHWGGDPSAAEKKQEDLIGRTLKIWQESAPAEEGESSKPSTYTSDTIDKAVQLAAPVTGWLGYKAAQKHFLPDKLYNAIRNLPEFKGQYETATKAYEKAIEAAQGAKAAHERYASGAALEEAIKALSGQAPDVSMPGSVTQLGNEPRLPNRWTAAESLTPSKMVASGVENYAGKFLPPEYTRNYPPLSMGHTQKELIPEFEAGMQKSGPLSGGLQSVEEASGLALSREDRAAVAERVRQEQVAAAERARQEQAALEMRRQAAIAQHQQEALQAQAKHEAAQAKATTLRNAMSDKGRLYNKAEDIVSSAKAAASPGELRMMETAKKMSPFMRGLGKLAMPAVVASIPYEGYEAAKALQRDQYMDALKHGAGAVGGALTLAPLAAAAGLMAPATAGTLAGAGALTGLGVLGSDVWDAVQNYLDTRSP